jgi:hypothetical protein
MTSIIQRARQSPGRAAAPPGSPEGIRGETPNGYRQKAMPASIDLRSPLFTAWTRFEEPTVALPCWHEPDGTPHTVNEMTAGLPAEKADEIERLNADAVRRLLLAAASARRRGDHLEARRLVTVAARLCEEVVGLWPISARSVHR